MKRDLLAQIKQDYAPYHLYPDFLIGFHAYERGDYRNPYEGVAAQAWDRGLECGMRYRRAKPQA